MNVKKKILLSPLFIIILIIIFGVGAAGAAIFFGGSGTSGEVNLQKGLAGWWKFDGNAKDATPNGNNGTVTGATLIADRKNQSGKAYSFDGIDDTVSFPTSGDSGTKGNLGFADTDDFTLSLWYKGSDTAQNGDTGKGLISRNNADKWAGFVLRSGYAEYIHYNAGWQHNIKSTTLVADNNWHHVVYVNHANETGDLYIDGVKEINGLSSTLDDAGRYFKADGLAISSVNQYTSGTFDDVRIYNRAISAAEVTALYESYGSGIVVSDLQKGLVGNWKLNGNARDSTPNSNNGTVTGADSTATDRKNQSSKAYAFLASSSHKIDIGNAAALNFERTDSFSMSVWAKRTVNGATQIFFSKEGTSSPFRGWDMRFDGTSNVFGIVLRTTDVGNKFITVNTTAAYTDSAWHLFGFTYDGTSSASGVKLYVDGVLAPSTVVTDGLNATMQSSASVQISGRGSVVFFTGSIDDVRVYNRVLTAAEVLALYQSYDPGIVVSNLQKGLVGNWKMDGNARDYTPNSNNGTVTDATLTADRKNQSSKAYLFNGTTDYITISPESSFDYERTQALSVSFWIKATSGASTQGIVTKLNPNSPIDGWGVALSSAGKMSFQMINTNSTNGLKIDTTDAFPLGAWKHFTATYDGSSTPGGVKMYIDGVAVGMTTTENNLTSSILNDQNLVFGSYGGANRFFGGSLDDVRIYNRVLTAAEVLALYQGY